MNDVNHQIEDATLKSQSKLKALAHFALGSVTPGGELPDREDR